MPVIDTLLDRWRRVPPLVADVALAAVVAVVTIISIAVDDANDPERHMTAWAWGLEAVQFVALVWRRRAPVVVAVVVGVAAFGHGAANFPDPTIIFTLALAVYSVGVYSSRRVSRVFAAGLVVAGLVTFAVDRQADAADVAVNYLVGITSWVLGDTMRSQRERVGWLAARQAAEAERAAADERVRIARDLHDIVAHHVSVIVVQAEAAQEVLANDPARAQGAMATVGDTARTALAELRRALGVLRSEDAARVPRPDLDSLDALVESVRGAGLTVEVRRTGEPRPMAGVVGVTAYRVVQEALTNVLRHADARRVCVDLDYAGDALVVRVTDDGRGPRRPGSPGGDGAGAGTGHDGRGGGSAVAGDGHGLVGMRERVAAVGGDLVAEPGHRGGFVVRARLPLGPLAAD